MLMRRPLAAAMLLSVAAAALLPHAAHSAGEAEGRRAGALMGETTRYLMVYEEGAIGGVTEGEVRRVVEAAGGQLLAWHPAIGTALAASQNTGFSPNAVAQDSRLQSVGPTAGAGVARPARLPPYERVMPSNSQQRVAQDLSDARVAATLNGWGDSLSGLQWDMGQVNVPGAQEFTKGRSTIIIGILDTGVDRTHPDLTAQIDMTRSVSCLGGVVNTTVASWDDDDGHGTWCASAAAAAENGRGIVGMAPRAKIAAVKVGDPDGFFYPEATVCGFMHAADSGISVTSNSYYTDPWLFNCKNDTNQNAIFVAVNRAVQYALSKKVDVIVAAGNDNQNLDDPMFDSTSPDNGTIIYNRPVDLNCPSLPLELSGVVGVAAVGNTSQKAYYSNYGSLFVQVTAPGGDVTVTTPSAPQGGVIGAYPAKFSDDYGSFVSQNGAYYAYLQGTSMATPHVAGLAALIRSAYSDASQPSTATVASAIMATAHKLPCPSGGSLNGATCTSAGGVTNFYGHGQIDALAAIRAGPQGLLRKPPPPTAKPTAKPTARPTAKPTKKPTAKPTAKPLPAACGGKCATPKPKPTAKVTAARALPAACGGKCATPKPKPTAKLPAACGGKCATPKSAG